MNYDGCGLSDLPTQDSENQTITTRPEILYNENVRLSLEALKCIMQSENDSFKDKDWGVLFLATKRAQGKNASELRRFGYSWKLIKEAGYTAKELKYCGHSSYDLKCLGFTWQELKDANYMALELRAAGASFSELIFVGYSFKELKIFNASATRLRSEGVSWQYLKDAGFSSKELRSAGATDEDIKKVGFKSSLTDKASFALSTALNNIFRISLK